jgi:hypothetical protein
MTVCCLIAQRRDRHPAVLEGALNLTPVAKALFYMAGVAVSLFFLYLILLFLARVFSAPFNFVSRRRRGETVDEFDEIVVFWGGVALVVALVVAAFAFHVVTFE